MNIKAVSVLAGILLLAVSCKKDDPAQAVNPPVEIKTLAVKDTTITDLSTGSVSVPVKRLFNLATGLEVPLKDSLTTKWDIYFMRSHIGLNGGTTGPGQGAGLIIADKDYDEIKEAPATGYIKDGSYHVGAGGEPNGIFADWYQYDVDTRLVVPLNQTYILRTADGKYAKLQILGYYNSSMPQSGGWFTFKYAYQPGGSRVIGE